MSNEPLCEPGRTTRQPFASSMCCSAVHEHTMLAAGLQQVRRRLLIAVRMGERAGPEGEVVQVLVQRMAGSAAAEVRGLVDEHGVHGLDVVANKARHSVENVRKLAVAEIANELMKQGIVNLHVWAGW